MLNLLRLVHCNHWYGFVSDTAGFQVSRLDQIRSSSQKHPGQVEAKIQRIDLALVRCLIKYIDQQSGAEQGSIQQSLLRRGQAQLELRKAQQAFSITYCLQIKGIFSLKDPCLFAQPQLGLEICPFSNLRQSFIHLEVVGQGFIRLEIVGQGVIHS